MDQVKQTKNELSEAEKEYMKDPVAAWERAWPKIEQWHHEQIARHAEKLFEKGGWCEK